MTTCLVYRQDWLVQTYLCLCSGAVEEHLLQPVLGGLQHLTFGPGGNAHANSGTKHLNTFPATSQPAESRKGNLLDERHIVTLLDLVHHRIGFRLAVEFPLGSTAQYHSDQC